MSSEDIKYLKSYVLFSHMELKHLEEISQLLERDHTRRQYYIL